jgi:hypothetical protein
MMMKDQFEREVFKAALRKLLDPQSHFCVIGCRNLLEMAGVVVTPQEERYFQALHCVSYKTMSRELKEGLVVRLAEIFQRGPDPLLAAAENLCAAVDRRAVIGQEEILRLVKMS